MKLTFIGATHEVTGSCTMIEINGHYGLVDCGMEQGEDIFENQEIPVNPAKLDFVLLTHAHIDHSGLIPLLYKRGYSGLVYATEATCNLCNIMLRDSAHIQESEAEWRNRKALRAGADPVEPIYTQADAERAIAGLRPCAYNTVIEIGEGVSIRFIDVGHLLGSASIEIWLNEGSSERKVVFSGDIGNINQSIIKDPQYIESADYVITESTYGDRNHEQADTDSVHYLASCIQRVLDRGGNLVIPSFAVGRTQEILYMIKIIKSSELVSGHGDFRVYVDSPLAVEATGIFLQCDRSCFDDETLDLLNRGVNPLMSPGVKLSVSTDESRSINIDKTPKVIISASGMCEAGRIRHHLKHNLFDSRNMVLFVGYQAEGTTGRKLLEGAKSVKLFEEEICVKAEIGFLPGKSGHADKDGLLRWINSFKEKPKMVFVNHGDDEVCKAYGNCLADEYGYEVSAPYSGAVFDLISDCFEDTPEGVRISKAESKAKKRKAEGAYNALVAACERLLNTAKSLRGLPNKELAKLTGQVSSLADKWTQK